MSKALLGTYATPRTIELLDEIRALRRRVAELEEALDAADVAQQTRVADMVVELEDAEAVRG